jgi:flagellar capping protein FliD
MTINELKTDMDARFSHVDRRFEALADLISHGFARMDERFEAMNTRFDTLATRLDRHAAYWQTGSR